MTSPLPAGGATRNQRQRYGREHPVAHKVELSGQVVAGGVGSAFGAAKLRDQHREQYPARHNATVKHAVRVVRAKGGSPQQAARVAHLLHGGSELKGHLGKPGFKSLVAAAGAGAVVTGAHRSSQISDAFHRRKEAVMKAACCTGELGNVPRTAHMRGIGKVRVIGYHGDGKFHVVDNTDSTRIASRERLNFHRTKENTMSKSAFGVEHPTETIEKAETPTLNGSAAFLGEISKFAAPFTDKAKKQRGEEKDLRGSLPKGKRRKVDYVTGIGETVKDAPKGKKKAAAKTHLKHVYGRPVHGTNAGAYARAKREHSF